MINEGRDRRHQSGRNDMRDVGAAASASPQTRQVACRNFRIVVDKLKQDLEPGSHREWSYLLQDLVASAQQRAFWLTNEIDPGTPVFNLLRVLRLEGMLHKYILARAFDDLVARHEVLRT